MRPVNQFVKIALPRTGEPQGYNAQASMTEAQVILAEAQVILAAEVTQNANDATAGADALRD